VVRAAVRASPPLYGRVVDPDSRSLSIATNSRDFLLLDDVRLEISLAPGFLFAQCAGRHIPPESSFLDHYFYFLNRVL